MAEHLLERHLPLTQVGPSPLSDSTMGHYISTVLASGQHFLPAYSKGELWNVLCNAQQHEYALPHPLEIYQKPTKYGRLKCSIKSNNRSNQFNEIVVSNKEKCHSCNPFLTWFRQEWMYFCQFELHIQHKHAHNLNVNFESLVCNCKSWLDSWSMAGLWTGLCGLTFGLRHSWCGQSSKLSTVYGQSILDHATKYAFSNSSVRSCCYSISIAHILYPKAL